MLKRLSQLLYVLASICFVLMGGEYGQGLDYDYLIAGSLLAAVTFALGGSPFKEGFWRA